MNELDGTSPALSPAASRCVTALRRLLDELSRDSVKGRVGIPVAAAVVEGKKALEELNKALDEAEKAPSVEAAN